MRPPPGGGTHLEQGAYAPLVEDAPPPSSEDSEPARAALQRVHNGAISHNEGSWKWMGWEKVLTGHGTDHAYHSGPCPVDWGGGGGSCALPPKPCGNDEELVGRAALGLA